MSQNMAIAANASNACTGYPQTTLITELRTGMSICIYGDEHLKLGILAGDPFTGKQLNFPLATIGIVI